jgi:Sulfotransferase family
MVKASTSPLSMNLRKPAQCQILGLALCIALAIAHSIWLSPISISTAPPREIARMAMAQVSSDIENNVELLEASFQLRETQGSLDRPFPKNAMIGLNTMGHYNHSNDIFWLHIQKTGTSFFTTIYLNLCPRILQKHPDLAEKERLVGATLVEEFPPSEWCEATLLNMPSPGYHHPYKTQSRPFVSFTMLRDPMERLQSAYAFKRHGTRLRNATNVSFEAFLNEPQVRLLERERHTHTHTRVGIVCFFLLLSTNGS